jgi:hypothetical protein
MEPAMTDTFLVTLHRRPTPNGGYHFMFVDHRDRAGFVPADQVPSIVGDVVVAEVTPAPSKHWPRWSAKAVLPFYPTAA